MSTSGSGEHRIVPYDPEWEGDAARVMDVITDALGDALASIEHVGSTSVEGLAARPIPDIQVCVRDVHDRDSFFPQLVAAGYEHFSFPELNVDDYFVFVPADGSNTEHVLVCETGSRQELRHLAVRDYLRTHGDEREAYEAVKRSAAERADGVREVYSAGKNDFIVALEQRALAWVTTRP